MFRRMIKYFRTKHSLIQELEEKTVEYIQWLATEAGVLLMRDEVAKANHEAERLKTKLEVTERDLYNTNRQRRYFKEELEKLKKQIKQLK